MQRHWIHAIYRKQFNVYMYCTDRQLHRFFFLFKKAAFQDTRELTRTTTTASGLVYALHHAQSQCDGRRSLPLFSKHDRSWRAAECASAKWHRVDQNQRLQRSTNFGTCTVRAYPSTCPCGDRSSLPSSPAAIEDDRRVGRGHLTKNKNRRGMHP